MALIPICDLSKPNLYISVDSRKFYDISYPMSKFLPTDFT